ncbi:MAG TPA: hypothetical protein VN372_01580, partial [Methanospirillum sp.]|nr:hypothetical protein [Methanospirillum sp.]
TSLCVPGNLGYHPPLTPPSRPNPMSESEPVLAGVASGSTHTLSASLPPQAPSKKSIRNTASSPEPSAISQMVHRS